MTVIKIDIENDIQQSVQILLSKDLENEYSRSVKSRGQRLYPHALTCLEFEGEDGWAQVHEKGCQHEVRVSLPVFDIESGYSSISCSCMREAVQLEPERCAHMWVVQKNFLEYLEQQATAQQSESESVESLLQAFEACEQSDDEPKKTEELNQPYLQWCLNSQWDLSVSSIKLDKITPLSWNSLFKKAELWENTSHQGALTYIRKDPSSGRYEVDRFSILQHMAHQGLTCYDQHGKQFDLALSPTSLVGRSTPEGVIVDVLFADGGKVEYLYEKGGAAGFSICGKKILITPLDAALEKLYKHLIERPIAVPQEQKGRLLKSFSRIEGQVLISLEDAADGGEADKQLIIRLTPQDRGTRCDILVKPSPSGPAITPGAGPECVLDTTDIQNPKTRSRDLWFEQEQAQLLTESLDLRRYITPAGFLLLPEAGDVLDLLYRLKGLQDTFDYVVEWPKNVKESEFEEEGSLDHQDLKLQVGSEQDWFDVSGGVEINGEMISLDDLMRSLKNDMRYIRLSNGRWARITDYFKERLAHLEELIDSTDDHHYIDPSSAVGLEDHGIEVSGDEWEKRALALSQMKTLDTSELQASTDFRGQLRNYQLEGFRWMLQLSSWGMGACLADDMGLGKTVQTLAVLQKRKAEGPSLIIAPVSVCANWCKEAQKFCPDLQSFIYRGKGRESILDNLMPHDIVVTSYGLVMRDVALLEKVSWNCIVLDEAQYVKNATSKTAQSIRQLKSSWTLALSGTPIENHLGELWSLFRTINPTILGPWAKFKKVYGIPISHGSQSVRAKLERRIKPFVLRRLKKDYLDELPLKTEVNLEVELSQAERDVYERLRYEALAKLKEGGEEDTAESSEAEAEPSKVQILAELTRLRQASCHPRLVQPDWLESSSKMELFVRLATQVVENGHKALVFSQFTSHLGLVREQLRQLGYEYAYLDGGVSQESRQDQIQEFQKGKYPFFLISLKAGGTGITLTEADIVIHMDPWWNPAVEDQATDRAYRIGQKRPVTVYRLISKGTIEGKILSMHQDKRELASSILGACHQAAKLDSKGLMNLI